MIVLVFVAVVVIAIAYWFLSGASIYSAPTGPTQGIPTPQTDGQLIDKYDSIIHNIQFTDALLRAQREALEKRLQSDFRSILTLPGFSSQQRVDTGTVIDEVNRIMSAPMDPTSQKQLQLSHDKAISALKKKSQGDLAAAIDALKRLGPQPMPRQ